MRRLGPPLVIIVGALLMGLSPSFIMSRKIDSFLEEQRMVVEAQSSPDERLTTIDCPALGEEVVIVTKRRRIDGEWESDTSLAARHIAGVQAQKTACAE